MELDQQIEALSSIAPLRVVQREDHVIVELEKTNIYHRDLHRAFLEALRNPENCEQAAQDMDVMAQRRLKPEIAGQFRHASSSLSVKAESFRQAIAKLHDLATSPQAVVEHLATVSAIAIVTVPEYFVFDEEQRVFKSQPRSFNPFC